MRSRERQAWESVEKHLPLIVKWAGVFDIPPSLIGAILYCESQQYMLFNIFNVLKRLKMGMSIQSFWRAPGNLCMSMNCSLGYAHIKPLTVQRADAWAHFVGEESPRAYLGDPDLAIKYACGILHALRLQWAGEFDLAKSIPVWATLYNISDFANKKPHSRPLEGGFKAPLCLGGRALEDVCFGRRVALVAASDGMKKTLSQV